MRGTAGVRAMLLAGMASLLLAGCSSGFDQDRGGARRGGSILVALAERPGSLDPATARSPEARQALWQVYTPPMTYRHAGGAQGTRMVAGLAEAPPTSEENGTVYAFRFRKGLRYSDGRPLLATDFVRALQRALVLNPTARRQLAGVVGADAYVRSPVPRQGIEGVTVDEATRTVRLELTAPDPSFPSALAELWAAPVPPGTPTREQRSSAVAGIGPYVLTRAPRGRAYRMTRRSGLRLPGVPSGNVDSIEGTVIPEGARRTSAALKGRIDVAQGEPPTAQLPRIRSEDKDRYREFKTLSARYLRFDLTSRPFSDGDIRQAVSFALDLRTLTRLDAGFLDATCNVLPSQVVGYEPMEPCPYGDRQGDPDLVRAERLVERARARRTPVIVDGGQGPRSGALARYGAETLRKIGMRARIPRTAAERRRATMRFSSTTPSLPAPASYFASIRDSGVASEAGELARGGTPSASAQGWAALDRTVVSDAIVAPYGVATMGVLVSERLDAENCLRFSPVYGADLSSLCLR